MCLALFGLVWPFPESLGESYDSFSPTRRMVYGTFALFFDVLMIPLLRDSTSLANTVRTIALKMAL